MAMEQMARNATLEELGCLHARRHLLHDRDTNFCESFREVLMDMTNSHARATI
jgi:hypothetical protein